MTILKSNYWKVIICIIIGVFADVILHILFVPRVTYNFHPSILAEKGLTLPAATVMLIVLFTAVTIVFVLIQKYLPGTKAAKGWRFGIAFGLLTFLAIIEMNLIFDSPILNELRGGAADGASLVLLALMLSLMTGTDNLNAKEQNRLRWKPFVLVPLFFLVGRYFSYAFVQILSAYGQKPCGTFFWTLGIGLWLSIMYQLLREERNDIPAIIRAIRFGCLTFGSYWLIYNLFVLVYLQTSVLDLFLRIIIDVVFVTTSIWIVEVMEHRILLKKTV
ncbi:MAG: hypothetical protein PHC43_08825 [Candidatus Marinimicrobia bacterium]|nr:hypothetical protein [Candidatus Neomarinimicrobiota bacterium]